MSSLSEPFEVGELPAELKHLAAYQWRAETIGQSASHVFQLVSLTGETLFLKVAARSSYPALLGEAERLQWLEARLPVPAVFEFVQDERRSYLLMSALKGEDATRLAHASDLPRLVDLLAEGLHTLHAVPTENCPFDHRLEAELARARQALLGGRVDEDDFDEVRLGRSAASLYEDLLHHRPSTEDLVFTHGDYSLPNIIVADGKVSGFVDLGAAGVGDRCRDLALAARSLHYNWGERWVSRLFKAYDSREADREKLSYFELLDEFF